jgi:hypothetical protein
MEFALPYDIHETIIAKNIKTHADFMRYLILVNNGAMAKMLMAKFADTFIINTFNTPVSLYVKGNMTWKDNIILMVINANSVIPFFDNVVGIEIRHMCFNPEMYINYTNIKEIRINDYFDNNAILLAKAFPNVRRINCNSHEYIAKIIDYFPNLKQVVNDYELASETDLYAKYNNIEFVFSKSVYSDTLRLNNLPNIKYRILSPFKNLSQFLPIADKIIDIMIFPHVDDGVESHIIPQQFREIRYLTIGNSIVKKIIISDFPNLETIIIYGTKEFSTEVEITNVPFLRNVQRIGFK